MDKLISVTMLILVFLTSFGMAYVDDGEEVKEDINHTTYPYPFKINATPIPRGIYFYTNEFPPTIAKVTYDDNFTTYNFEFNREYCKEIVCPCVYEVKEVRCLTICYQCSQENQDD